MPDACKSLKLNDVWRTCNKIRAAIFRLGLDLWKYYKPLDPKNTSLISESKFVSVLAGPLKGLVGLSEKEICDLADYFRVQDGRILYTQLCDVIHDSVPEFDKNKPLITGLEWEDPLHVNRVSASELRRLNLIITQIAILVNKRKLVLRPYFQDYELIAKNVGTVTLAHFGRILKFLDIVLASDEFRLLVKRFAKDAYTINYVAFVKAIDEVQNYLIQHGIVELGGDLLPQFPGRVITAELPKLPRPEIGKVPTCQVFGKQTVFHPVLELEKKRMPLMEIIRRIQRHIFEHRIRIQQYFKDYDPLNIGKIKTSQFRRGLDSLQISTLGRLYLSESEIEELICLYKDPNDPNEVCWRTFEDDIDHVFTIKELEKLPNEQVNVPPPDIAQCPRKGQSNWQCEQKSIRDLCECTLLKIKQRVEERRICLKPAFKDHDRSNLGHVTRAEMRQILTVAAILLSQEEQFALEQRYNDDLGFNYNWFLQELEGKSAPVPLYNELLKEKKRINAEKRRPNASEDESNILLILAKIKAKVVRERVAVIEFMRLFDVHNERVIKKADFIRGLDQLRCNLTLQENDTLTEIFHAPLRPDFVDYVRFGETVEEAIAMGSLERAPLLVPIQHIPSEASRKTFLNFHERQSVAVALEKLCKVQEPNLIEIFKNYDKENVGTITKDQFTKALSIRRMLDLVSNNEVSIIHKCFGMERGGRLEMNYRVFLHAVDILRQNKKYLPF